MTRWRSQPIIAWPKFLIQTPDLLDTSSISASSLVTTPREYFTPRSAVHSSASVSKASVTSVTPNTMSPRDATLSSPLEVISEDEAATQAADCTDGLSGADNTGTDAKKFKMRPPKMSSFTTADAPKAAEFQVVRPDSPRNPD